MEGDDVGLAQDCLEVTVVAPDGQDTHVEAGGATRDGRPDAAGADDAESRAAHLAPVPEPGPASRADEPVARDDSASRREHQRHREIGGGGVEHTGRVRHCDAAGARGRDVDAVVADAVVRDQAEGRIELEVDRLVQHDQHLDVRPGRIGRRHLDALQLVPCRPRKAMGRSDLHTHDATTLPL